MKLTIKLTQMSAVSDFVKLNSSMPFEIDVASGHYVVDGKSILGVLSLDSSKKIDCILHTDNAEFCSLYVSRIKEFAGEVCIYE